MTTTTLPAAGAQKTAFIDLRRRLLPHDQRRDAVSLLVAIYPILKDAYGLDFVQIGLLSFTFQVTASLLQPVIGIYTDKRPLPYSLPVGMGVSSTLGLVVLGFANSYGLLLLGSALGSGLGRCSIPKARGGAAGVRRAAMAWRNRLFQVGGNAGSALGPVLAAFVVLPRGQSSIAWFGAVGRWSAW